MQGVAQLTGMTMVCCTRSHFLSPQACVCWSVHPSSVPMLFGFCTYSRLSFTSARRYQTTKDPPLGCCIHLSAVDNLSRPKSYAYLVSATILLPPNYFSSSLHGASSEECSTLSVQKKNMENSKLVSGSNWIITREKSRERERGQNGVDLWETQRLPITD